MTRMAVGNAMTRCCCGSRCSRLRLAHADTDQGRCAVRGGRADRHDRAADRSDMQARLKSDIVIENKGGAGGVIANEQVARAPADGKTLLFASSARMSSARRCARQLSYDPLKSFTPIAFIGQAPSLIVVSADYPAKTLAELIAKAKTDKLSYGSAGAGTTMHIVGEMFNAVAGMKTTHVPYRGVGAGDQRSDRRPHSVPERRPAGAAAACQKRQAPRTGELRLASVRRCCPTYRPARNSVSAAC